MVGYTPRRFQHLIEHGEVRPDLSARITDFLTQTLLNLPQRNWRVKDRGKPYDMGVRKDGTIVAASPSGDSVRRFRVDAKELGGEKQKPVQTKQTPAARPTGNDCYTVAYKHTTGKTGQLTGDDGQMAMYGPEDVEWLRQWCKDNSGDQYEFWVNRIKML